MTSRARAGRRILPVLIAVPLLVLLVVAAFPFGLLKGVVADRLTKRFGRPVTIGSLDRVDTIGFTPTIRVRDVTIRQAGWAGDGDFLRLREARVTFPVWPLLTGTFRPRDVVADGLQLALVRNAGGRTNWARPGEAESGGASNDLKGLTIRDATLRYRDDKRRRSAVVQVVSDARGFRARGTGTIRGVAVRLRLDGASVAQPAPGPWPFTATIAGDRLSMQAKGATDVPLDTDRMTLDVTAKAADLRLIDAVIEAGLFGTQAVALTAHVRHDAPRWIVNDLTGTIGQSDIAGRVTVDKRDGRTTLDGAMTASRFDFADLSSDEGRAEAAAQARAIGPRVVPDTRIDLSHIGDTDGRIAIRIARVVSRDGATPVRALSTVLTLDHKRLDVAPLTLALAYGTARGSLRVDQRDGAPAPRLTLDMRLDGTRLAALPGTGGDFTGRIAARAQLSGRGDTIRAAVGRSDGRIGFVVRDGSLPQRYAAALGFDAGRALLAGEADRAQLRCVIVGLTVRGGLGQAAPLIVDTSASQLHGTGTVRFPAERLDMRLTGAPKGRGLLRLPGAAFLTGTLSAPEIVIPPEVKSVGNVLKALGRAITGDQAPRASDANCAALSARVLR